MSTRPNIVLVGFMGTGKTVTARILSTCLRMPVRDMDKMIENRLHKPISRIFSEDGEAFFRSAERNMVVELASQYGCIISTGGGIVLNADNVRDFHRNGLVVCLSATPDKILERIGHDTSRPLMAGDDKLKKIAELLGRRKSLYDSIPIQIDTTPLTPDQVADKIAELYQKHCATVST